MPELPEVETIRLGLQKKIIGLTIKQVELLTPKSFFGDSKDITGKKIVDIWRRAKILGLSLRGAKRRGNLLNKETDSSLVTRNDNEMTLLFHLKMTGQLIFDDGSRFIGGHPTPDMRDEMPNRSTRVVFTFNDGSKLYFNDQRRFGWVRVIGKVGDIGEFTDKLGPEPLEEDFTWQILKQNLLRYKRSLRTKVLKTLPIKVALLDQSVVSGIGNIYASEACFNAKINPKTLVGNLTDKQFKDLHQGILRALKDGIKHGGSTRTHFVDSEGNKGYFLDYAFVYSQENKPCKVCGTTIEKFQLRGRGTYWCSTCQK